MNATALHEALMALRVTSGLRMQSPRPIDGPWRVGLEYSREGHFVAVLYRGARSSRMALTDAEVETRGRSMWKADNTWRLSSAGIARVEASALSVAAKEPKS